MRCGGNPPLAPAEFDPEEAEASEEELDRLVSRIETLHFARLAGGRVDPEDLEPWEWSGLVAWTTYEAQYSRLQQAKLVALLGGMNKKGPGSKPPGGSRR